MKAENKLYENKYGDRNKLKPRYKKKVVKEVVPNKIIIKSGNIVKRKNNIKDK